MSEDRLIKDLRQLVSILFAWYRRYVQRARVEGEDPSELLGYIDSDVISSAVVIADIFVQYASRHSSYTTTSLRGVLDLHCGYIERAIATDEKQESVRRDRS